MNRNLTASEFEARVLMAERPVLVEFYTPDCPACRAVAPALEGLAKEFDGRAEIVGVNAAQETALSDAFQVSAVPTFVLFSQGQPAITWVGGRPAAAMLQVLEAALQRRVA